MWLLARRAKLMGLPQHESAVSHERDAQEMEQVERARHRGIGLEELPDEALGAIAGDEEIEAMAQEERGSRRDLRQEHDQEREHGEGFIELHRMPRDAIAEVDAPRQPCRNAVGVVRKPGKKAAPAPDGDPQRERRDEDEPGRAANAGRPLEDLDRDDAAEDGPADAVTEQRLAGEVEVEAAEQQRAGQGAG